MYTAAGNDDSLRSLLEKTFEDNPHDPSFSTTEWPKSSICVSVDGEGDGSIADAGLGLDVPKMDLFAELPSDCVDKMVSDTGFIKGAENESTLLKLASTSNRDRKKARRRGRPERQQWRTCQML